MGRAIRLVLRPVQRGCADQVHRQSDARVREPVAGPFDPCAVHGARPAGVLVRQHEADASGLSEQPERANVRDERRLDPRVRVLDAQDRVQEEIAVRVGVPDPEHVETRRKMGPPPGLQVLRARRRARDQEDRYVWR